MTLDRQEHIPPSDPPGSLNEPATPTRAVPWTSNAHEIPHENRRREELGHGPAADKVVFVSEELDDDWFERALEEREGDDETDAAADVTRLTSSNPSTTEDGSAVDLASSVEAEGEGIADAAAEAVEGDAVEAAGDLAVVDIDPVGMANRLDAIQEELPALIEELGASRPVLDSVSLPEVMYDDRARRRNEISDFAQSLKEAGETALLTSVASADTPYASRYGIVEYLTDSVFVIQYVRPDDFGETRPAVEIRKIRDANHSREERPYEITSDGTSSYQQANLF